MKEYAGYITITVQNFSSFDRYVEVVDEISGRTVLSRTMAPWEQENIQICHNDPYGEIRYDYEYNNRWIHSSLLSDGDHVNI
jgi:hypothetical protein